jgi:hypothetical protein
MDIDSNKTTESKNNSIHQYRVQSLRVNARPDAVCFLFERHNLERNGQSLDAKTTNSNIHTCQCSTILKLLPAEYQSLFGDRNALLLPNQPFDKFDI